MPRPGTVLQDRFEIIRVLGYGAMGRVYLAHHLGLGNLEVAIKELDMHVDPETLELVTAEFQKEATILAHLEHPGIIRASDFFEENGLCYIVMDYVAGPTLHEVAEGDARPAPAQVLDWADQLCDALAYLHGRTPPILHRDVKPGNMLLAGDGRVRLIDFGLSRFYQPGLATVSILAGSGTHGFAPVEQYSGGTSERSDVYALGASLYHLLTGTVPPNSVGIVTGQERLIPPRELNSEVAPELQSVLLKMLSLKAEDRYPTIEDTRDALRRAAGQAATARQHRICALCRHLGVTAAMEHSYDYSCAVLGWTTQEDLVEETVARHLQLDSRKPRECPYWEPA